MDILLNNLHNFLTGFTDEISIQFFARFLVNSVSTFVLIRYIYYPNNKNISYFFTFFLMGVTIFLIASILDSITLEFGFAIGLFAIFSIIRFKTLNIELKEMTYLFMIIGTSIINSMIDSPISNAFILFIGNLSILGAAYFMEWYTPKRKYQKKPLMFTPSDLSIIEDDQLLIEEVKTIIGIDVVKVEVTKVNANKKELSVWIYYAVNNKLKK